MSKSLKIAAYAAMVICAVWCGLGFYSHYTSVGKPILTDSSTNNVAPAEQKAGNFNPHRASGMMKYGAGVLAMILGLGMLSGRDISHFLANRVEAFIFNDEGESIKNPEYEHAEDIWRDGKPLEAIQLMRDYLLEHPREQYVALRIAEIYEQDLGNYLAAALEYEEILNKKLPPERWGWSAIHLANLYSGKLNRVKDAEKLLHRIVEEYGDTVAAKKARQRLGIPEPVEPKENPQADSEAEKAETAKPAPEPPKSKLPPGFRPKTN